MGQRVLVAVIGVPVLVYVVLWAPMVVMAAALCILAGVGAWELQQCVGGGNRHGWECVILIANVK